MRIFIQEYASGGGLAGIRLDFKLIIEGFGMLRTLILAFKKEKWEIVTTLDFRLAFLSTFLHADQIKLISHKKSFLRESKKLIKKGNYFLFIAPTTDGLLAKIVHEYQKSSITSLNCSPETISFLADKSRVYSYCSQKDIQIPRTFVIKPDNSFKEISNNTNIINGQHWMTLITHLEGILPVVVKPNDGVACEGIVLCETADEVINYLEKKKKRTILIQEFIKGENLSATLNVKKKNIQFLSINKQLVLLGKEYSEYLGGITNIEHQSIEKVKMFCKKLLVGIKGLNGLIGIDFIINNKNEIIIIEINPRATTSICGLKAPLQAFIQSITNNITPESGKNEICYFAKEVIDLPKSLKKKIYNALIAFDFLITPPLFLKKNSYGFLMYGSANEIKLAEEKFQENLSIITNKLKKEFYIK